MDTADAVVVGAGIAGLVAAARMSGAGLRVAVLEARDRVGGRAVSEEVSGGHVDLGASWFWPNESFVSALAGRLGVAVHEQSLEGDTMLDGRGLRPERVRGNVVDVPSFRFTHGAQSLGTALAEQLPTGTLSLGEPVTNLTFPEGGPVRVRSSQRVVECEHVVLALPPGLAVETVTFDPVLPVEVERIARRSPVWMGQTIKAVAVYETAFWRNHGLAGAAISYHGPFREFHDHSGPAGGPAAIFGFAPSAELAGAPASMVAATFVSQLTQLFGRQASEPLRVVFKDWAKETATSPTAAAGGPADYGLFGHPAFQEPIAGCLHWASTEVASAFAGHLEGAVRAGSRAADEVIAAMRSRGAPRVETLDDVVCERRQ